MTAPFASVFEFGKPRLYFGTGNMLTIHVPKGARFLDGFLLGPGGNGGAGASGAAGTSRGGGGGGGAGGFMIFRLPTALLPRTIFLQLPQAGAGGTSKLLMSNILSDDNYKIVAGAPGNNGADGSGSAAGGGGGISGDSLGRVAVFGPTNNTNGPQSGANGGYGDNAGASSLVPPQVASMGGSGGAGVATADQYGGYLASPSLSPAVQANPGQNGFHGPLQLKPWLSFTAGSGGGSSNTGTGGSGGNGAPGCGGGGGGAGVTGSKGGLGGCGFAQIQWS